MAVIRVRAGSWFSPRSLLLASLVSLLLVVDRAPTASQVWQSTANLLASRASHHAFLLSDGRVFVAGNTDPGGGAPDLTTAFFSPVTNGWTSGPSAALDHSNSSSVRLADGRILVTGGRNGGIPLTTSEIYNPAINTWEATTPMRVARVLHTLTLLPDGRVLAAGGYNFNFDNTAELFDPSTGQWTMTGSMSVGKWQHTATLLDDGRVLVAGGENYNCCGQKMTIAEYYVPANGAWSPAPSLAAGRSGHRAVKLADGRVLVVGGDPDFVAPTAATTIFNPATSTWTAGAPMLQARDSFPLLPLSDGTLLVTGGRVSFSGTVTAATERYNPATNTWTAGPSMTSPRQSHTATQLADGRVLVAAGHDGSALLNSAELLVDDAIAPSTTASPSPGPNGAGWNTSNVTVTLTAADNSGGSGVQSIHYDTSLDGGATWTPGATFTGNSGSVPIAAEGATTLRYSATDNAGNGETPQTLTVRIDKTPPLVSGALPNAITTTATSSAGAVVTFTISTPFDALSGAASVGVSPIASGGTFPIGTTHEIVTAFDVAGNSASAGFDVTVNPARPVITISGGTFAANGQPRPATATATDTNGNSVAGTFTITYSPGGASAPVTPGRYTATATFTSSDPAFASTADPWTTMAPDPRAKGAPAVVALNGKLYVQGFDQDANGNQSSFVPRLSIYDSESNTWTIGASPSLIRAFTTAAAIAGKLYIVGGCVMSDCRIGVQGARVLEIYDPSTNTWSTGAQMPTGRYGAASGVIGGKLYVAGGVTECPPCTPTTVTEVYDPGTNSWTSAAPIPTSREMARGAVVNNLLYVIGGYERGTVNASVSTVHVFDPADNSWSMRSPMPLARTGFAVGVINDEIYAAGGVPSTAPTGVNEKYNPATDTWTELAPMPTARQYVTGDVVNSKLYVIDGFNAAQLTVNEAYDPSNDATALITILNDTTPPTTTATASPAANGAGWNKSNVTVTMNATDNAGGSGVQSISYQLSGAQSGGATLAGASASVLISNEGTTTVTYHAVDGAGNPEGDRTFTVKIDKTLPFISYPVHIQTVATSSAGAPVTFVLSGSDNGSGLAGAVTVSPLSSGATFPPGTTHETVTATDVAGNVATATFDVIVNPARPIVIVTGGTFTFDGNPHPATATAKDAANNPIAGSFTFSYLPGGTAPTAAGRYSADASFTSSDPAFTNALPWTTKAADPHAKNSPAVVAINGKLYVQGFDQDPNGSQGSFVARLGIYDPFSNTWTAGASPSLIRAFANAVAVNGKMYVVGGCIMSDCRIGVQGARVLEIYDPGTNTWTTGASMPTGRYGAAAGVINGKLIVAGGTTECPPCGPTTVTEIYDPNTNTWSSAAPIPTSRELAVGAAFNGLLYVIGGYERGSVNASVGTVSVYDPIANTWSTRSPMLTPRTAAAAGVANREIYVIGGVGSSAPLATSESYDPQSDTWTPRQPMPTARTNVSGGVVNSTIYVIDGYSNGLQTTNEAYDTSLSTIITINPGDTTPPTTTASFPAPNANGWNRFNVHVTLNAFDPGGSAPASGVQSITYALSGAQTGGGTSSGINTQFDITTEGTTTVTYHATDNRGNVEADHSFTIKLDKTPPNAANLGNITANATSTSGALVTFDLAAADAPSGVDAVVFTQGLPSGSTFPHGTTNESVTITDKAGNTTFRSFSVTVNKSLLSIAVSPSALTIKNGQQSQPFTALGHFTQGPDQMLPSSGGSPGGGGGGGTGTGNRLLWDVYFAGASPSGGMALNVDACAATPVAGGFSSEVLTTDVSTGVVVPTTWEPSNPVVQVASGQITPTQVSVTLRCANSPATASFAGTWNGTRYVGAYTDFAGHSDTVTVSAHSLIATGRTDTQLQLEWGANGNTSFTVDYLDPSYFNGAQPSCSDFPPHNNIFETTSDPVVIGGLQPSTWYHIHVHPLDASHHVLHESTNVILVKTRASGSGFESLWSDSPDYVICGGGGSSGGSSSSLPTVTWQSTDQSVATIDGSGTASGRSAGETTIVATAAGVSCAATNSCATLTVVDPPHITLTLAAGSESFTTVQVTAVDPSTGESFGPFDVPIGDPQEVDAGQMRLVFTAPAGHIVTPEHVDLDLHNGDNVGVALLFALIDTTPPTLIVPPDQTAEATSASGATVTFPMATATDSGSGVKSVACDHVSGDLFPIGSTRVNCSATDNSNNTANGSFTVTVRDTTPPVVSVPRDITLEAAGPNGTAATFNASATDLVDGARTVTCSPASGSTFPLGVTQVICTATDTHDNTGQGSFRVFVQDTTPPVVRVVRPAPDDLLPFAPSAVTVEVEVTEAVGLSQVFINNIHASQSGGTTPVTRWTATVPAQPDGVAFTVVGLAYDTSGRSGQATSTTDNDGIEKAIDRNRTTFADESFKFSSEFDDGGTRGTITRGPGAHLTAVKRNGGVGVTLLNGGMSQVSFCSGSKYLVLDRPGESADVSCSGSTVTVKAYTPNKIELFKWTNGIKYITQSSCYWVSGGFFSHGYSVCFPVQIPVSYQYWYQIDLGPGQQVSTGSPVTAAIDNTAPIHVTLLQINEDDSQIPVATFDLDPGASADVDITQGANREDLLDFVGLAGNVTVSIGGIDQTIAPGGHAALQLDNTPPVLHLPSDVVVEGASPNGAVAVFTTTATDNLDGTIPVTCTPPSGSTFPIGTTSVDCSVMDVHGNPATGSFLVTVRDTTPPELTVPANISKPATTFAGAPVAFTVSATDLVDGTRPFSCAPASDSRFPIGTTTVTCTAADTRGNSATQTFTVTITFSFQQARSLLQELIASARSRNIDAVCSDLGGIITIIQSQVGIHLTQAEANTLIKMINDARKSLKCS